MQAKFLRDQSSGNREMPEARAPPAAPKKATGPASWPQPSSVPSLTRCIASTGPLAFGKAATAPSVRHALRLPTNVIGLSAWGNPASEHT
eukprot:5324034-Heterocapsa_arctica.AAC.1